MAAKLVAPVLFGATAAAVLAIAAPAHGGIPLLFISGFVVFFGLLSLAPWLYLRNGLRWWTASLVGNVIGFVSGLIAAVPFGGFSICIAAPCPPPPYPFGVLFTVNLGVLGLAQAVTLKGRSTRVTWFFGSLLAGAALGFAEQLLTYRLGLDRSNFNLVPGAVGGALWGVVIAVTLNLAQRRRLGETGS